MRFRVLESAYNGQGTAKAFADTDSTGHSYYIPRSQVKIVERIEQRTFRPQDPPYYVLVIDVPDWIIHKNLIPIFEMTNLQLVR